MTNEDQQDRIDDYLAGRLADPGAFEREMERDPQLKQEMEATRLALDAIQISEHDRLKARLRSLEAQRPDTAAAPAAASAAEPAKVVPIRRSSSRRWLSIAAAVALILFAAIYFLPLSSGSDNVQLALAEVEPLSNMAYTFTKGGEPVDEARADAYAAYEKEDYAAATAAFRELPAPPPADRFYLAQSLFAQGDYAAAEPIFTELAALPDFRLAEEAEFYRAAALLGTGNSVDARALLSRIADTDGHASRAEARALLEKL